MRRILVVDHGLHTRLAIGIWLKRCGVQGRDHGGDGSHRPLPPNQKNQTAPLYSPHYDECD
jgi:hypothetical protein